MRIEVASSGVVPEALVAPGRYHIDLPLRDAMANGTSVVSGAARLSFDLPAGWTGQPAGWAITKGGNSGLRDGHGPVGHR